MKSIKLIICSIFLVSCSSTDSFLIKNIGLNSKDIIALSLDAKNRMDANKQSGKEVVNPQPNVILETQASPVSDKGMFDGLWNLFQ